MPNFDFDEKGRTKTPPVAPPRGPSPADRARAALARGLRRLEGTRAASLWRRRPAAAVSLAVALVALAGGGFAVALYGVPEWLALPDGTRSLTELSKRASAEPSDAEARLELGHAQFAKKRPRAALASYGRALALDRGVADDRLVANLLATFGRGEQGRAEALIAKHKLVEAAEGLAGLAKDRRYGVRWGAIRTLDKLGKDTRAVYVAAYVADLGSPDCDVRRRAAEKLAKVGDRSALSAIRAAKKEDEKTGGFLRGTCLGDRDETAEKAILAKG
jgi:hypothetical protein